MAIPVLYSVKAIERQFNTGEEPVLVTCSDMNTYICKYMRSSAAAYKLLCELIGAQMAMSWQLDTPEVAFVKIKPSHWNRLNKSHNLSALAIGSKRVEDVVDITPSTFIEVNPTDDVLRQLIKIALFDFWIANEDRNANNANLMYNMLTERLVSIDYGCILNTATFDLPLSQLTSTDTILYSDLFHHLVQYKKENAIDIFVDELKNDYDTCLNNSMNKAELIIDILPKDWNIATEIVESKLTQLFDKQWIVNVWDNFMECLNENSSNE